MNSAGAGVSGGPWFLSSPLRELLEAAGAARGGVTALAGTKEQVNYEASFTLSIIALQS